jgi:hypothetical protein
MIQLGKTDTKALIRFLKDAEAFYREHACNTRQQDRARLLLKMRHKLERKLTKTNI